MRFSEFADFVNAFTGERPEHQRLGQWAANLLFESHPDIADEIRTSGVDPFFRDDRIPAFLCKLLTDHVEMD